jgi:hypothetical protein
MAKRAHAALLGLALGFAAAPSAAEDAPSAETTQVTVVDVDALPKGELPPLPGENEAPLAVPAWTQPATITVTAAGEMSRPRRLKPSIRVAKKSIVARKTPKPSSSYPSRRPRRRARIYAPSPTRRTRS